MISRIILVDSYYWVDLLPLTYTRPVSDLRCGGLTIAQKWEIDSGLPIGIIPNSQLNSSFSPEKNTEGAILVKANVLPNPELVKQILDLQPGQVLTNKQIGWVALHHIDTKIPADIDEKDLKSTKYEQIEVEAKAICNIQDIFMFNASEIISDYNRLNKIPSQKLSDAHTVIYNPENVFIGNNVNIKAAILNAAEGPIYIADNAQIQEGAIIKGPVFIGESAVIMMGAKIRPATTIGPFCRAGGEISNSVMWGYSNKGHDGFMGNSVLGAWCNLGADTNTSNLKNNYSQVKVFNYRQGTFTNTGLQFCGLTMADHSRAGINTMFNTGTVVGVGVNVFGGGFPSKFIPSFSWLPVGQKSHKHDIHKLIETERIVMERRNVKLTDEHIHLLYSINKIAPQFENLDEE